MTSQFPTVPAAANDAHTTFPPYSTTRYAAILAAELQLGALRPRRDVAGFAAVLSDSVELEVDALFAGRS